MSDAGVWIDDLPAGDWAWGCEACLSHGLESSHIQAIRIAGEHADNCPVLGATTITGEVSS